MRSGALLGVLFVLFAPLVRGGLHDEPSLFLLAWLICGAWSTTLMLRDWHPQWPGWQWARKRSVLLLPIAGWAIGLTILITGPHDSHALDQRRQGWCRSHVEWLGGALERYADEHGGNYPDRPEALLAEELAVPDAFVCPSTTDRPVGDATPTEQADELASGGHFSYIYVGRGQTKATTRPDTVLLYEPPDHHQRDRPGLHVLYAGERVEYLEGDAARRFAGAMWTAGPPRASRPHPEPVPPPTPTR